MEGVQGRVTLVLIAATLAFHSVNCKPFAFPFPQPTGTSGGSRFPAYSPISSPYPNPFSYLPYIPGYIPSFSDFTPFTQGGARARSQSRVQGKQVASEQFFEPLVSYLVSIFANRIANRISSNVNPVDTHTEAAHQQSEQVENEAENSLIDMLTDELIKEFQDALSNDDTQPLAKQESDADTQTPSLFSRENWSTARDCLNDVFGGNGGVSVRNRQAAISEFRNVWMGKTALSQASAQVRLNWPVIRDCVDRFANRNNPNSAQISWWPFGQKCNLQLYVMAYTGGSINALNKHPPFIELTVGGKVGLVQLQIVTGLEFALNKGDMWTIDLTDFGFTDKCIKKRDVDGIAVVEGGTDGWLIDTIVTFLLDEDGSFSLLSSDIDVDVWIDGNSGEERKRFDLTLD